MTKQPAVCLAPKQNIELAKHTPRSSKALVTYYNNVLCAKTFQTEAEFPRARQVHVDL